MTTATSIARSLASQRVAGHGRLVVKYEDGATRLAELYQEGAAKLRLPRPPDHGTATPLETVLINTAGGMTGGDRLDWTLGIGDGASLSATTQACEKIYRSAEGQAQIRTRVKVGAGARLAWLPQETILFDRSALSRQLDVELGEGASALVVEAVLFGRHARGETVERALFRDRWRIRAGGRLIHAEDFAIGPQVARSLSLTAGTGGRLAIATVLMIGEGAEHKLDGVREIIGDEGGASFWRVGATGKLLARLYAGDGYNLRQRLVPLIGLLNGRAGLPKIWTL